MTLARKNESQDDEPLAMVSEIIISIIIFIIYSKLIQFEV